MLKTPERNPYVSARPVKMSGVARRSVSPNARGLPNEPASSAENAATGLPPVAAIKIELTMTASTMESSGVISRMIR